MFYGNWDDLEKWQRINPELTIITEYLVNLKDFTKQQVIINSEIKANFLDYNTKQREEVFWEAHKKDIDLHYMVNGNEYIDLAHRNHLNSEEYHEEDDYYFLQGTQEKSICLSTGQFLLLFPDEPHKTGICLDTPKTVQKIVFKIRK